MDNVNLFLYGIIILLLVSILIIVFVPNHSKVGYVSEEIETRIIQNKITQWYGGDRVWVCICIDVNYPAPLGGRMARIFLESGELIIEVSTFPSDTVVGSKFKLRKRTASEIHTGVSVSLIDEYFLAVIVT